MAAPANFEWTFKDVATRSKDRTYFVASHQDAEETDLPVTHIACWKAGAWVSKAFQVRATRLAFIPHPEPHLLLMAIDGRIVRWDANASSEEEVDKSQEGPRNVGDLREVRSIGKHAYVAGMGRTVYRCDGPASWVRIDKGVRVAVGDESDAGFNSIHGFDDKDIYAAGWDGEVWTFDGKKWRKRETPTNVGLYRVHCAPDGNVYVAGQGGTILVGTKDRWSVLEHDATEEDFYGSAWFRDRLYLSTPNGIFVVKNRTLEKLEIKPHGKAALKFRLNQSFSKLDATDEALWSEGQKMVMFTEDGVTWTEVGYP